MLLPQLAGRGPELRPDSMTPPDGGVVLTAGPEALTGKIPTPKTVPIPVADRATIPGVVDSKLDKLGGDAVPKLVARAADKVSFEELQHFLERRRFSKEIKPDAATRAMPLNHHTTQSWLIFTFAVAIALTVICGVLMR